jgi:hypothetical protein
MVEFKSPRLGGKCAVGRRFCNEAFVLVLVVVLVLDKCLPSCFLSGTSWSTRCLDRNLIEFGIWKDAPRQKTLVENEDDDEYEDE